MVGIFSFVFLNKLCGGAKGVEFLPDMTGAVSQQVLMEAVNTNETGQNLQKLNKSI